MRQVVMLALCAALLSGCVSVNKGNRSMGSIIGQNELPEPGQWCVVELTPERLGPASKRLRFLWGHVESVDELGLQLVDAIEEERTLTGPMTLRRVPLLSGLTSFDSEFHLKESRRVAREEIRWCAETEEVEVVVKRDSLIQVGDKLVQKPRGLDFDFAAPMSNSPQSVAEQLTAAVPGSRWIARR